MKQPLGTFKARTDQVFDLMAAHENTLAARFLDFLGSKPGVRLLGPAEGDAAIRIPTFSFTIEGRASAEIPPLLQPAGIAIGQGNFYAPRLLEALGITDTTDGVLRASMVHYNTMDEVDRLIAALDEVI